MSERRGKMRAKNGVFAAVFSSGKQQIFRIERETTVKINSRKSHLQKNSRTNNLAIELFLEGFKNDLATI